MFGLPPTRRKETDVKRGKVYVKRRIIAAVLVIFLGIGVWYAAGAAAELISDATTPDFVCHVDSVVVESGDTIWDLVREYCDGDVSYVEWLIIEMRGSASLNPGDVVIFPKER